MEEIKIEAGVPIPEKRHHRKFPFADLRPGRSIWSKERSVVQAAHAWAKRHKKKIVTRGNEFDEAQKELGWRVWLVK